MSLSDRGEVNLTGADDGIYSMPSWPPMIEKGHCRLQCPYCSILMPDCNVIHGHTNFLNGENAYYNPA
jgi:hypothetical protein